MEEKVEVYQSEIEVFSASRHFGWIAGFNE
jgi:hypothetical protein